MILAVDIGNTNIDLALIRENGKIAAKLRCRATVPDFRSVAAGVKEKIETIIIVSVVPSLTPKVRESLRNRFKRAKIHVVGKDIKVPLKCAYNKKQIGQDRLVTAFAAKMFYGLPVVIIDFGTAVTFDTVTKSGVYAGGLIIPGIKMSLESLSERTAMLPLTYLKDVRSFVGRDTKSSIRSGLLYGYAALCDGLIKLFRKKIGKNIKVIATGGDAPLISRHTSSMKKIDPDLSLKGLYLLSRAV